MNVFRVEINGEFYEAEAVESRLYVYWAPIGAPLVKIGELKKWSRGKGWLVYPRIGGHKRAQEARKGLGNDRRQAIRRLIDLARLEASMTVYDKVRFGIFQDEGGQITDKSDGLPAFEG